MSKKHNGKKQVYKNIARRRITILFSLAETYGQQGKLHLANRYVALARRISMRYLVPIPKQYAYRFCKHCYSYLLPSVTSRTRIHRGMIIIYCTKCNKYTRMPIHRDFISSVHS
jgi:ribonuclease P protein subunit RPR2